MRRDMELIRKILFEIAEGQDVVKLDPLNSEDKLYEYHIILLKQAELIDYRKKFTDMTPKMYIEEPRLTWEGNDYLDNIENDNVWNDAKHVIKSNGLELSNVPFSVLKDLLTSLVKSKIGL